MGDAGFLFNWPSALTLSERARTSTRTNLLSEYDPAIGERRLRDWNEASPFDDPSILRQRLAVDGLDLIDFKKLLAADFTRQGPDLQALGPTPHWASDIEAAIQNGAAPVVRFGGSSVAFLNLVAPLTALGQEKLRRSLETGILSSSDAPLTASDAVQFFSPKLHRIVWERISRVAVLEMYVAKMRGQLVGGNSSERFQYYIDSLPHRSREILNEYPVLARYVWSAIHNWSSEVLSFCRNLVDDWHRLERDLNSGHPLGRLQDVRDSGSDLHQHGKSVLVLAFESGPSIIYKPRSLAVDEHFQSFLRWINAKLERAPFSTMKVVDCGTHGWTKFIECRECNSADELDLFYERIGGYLAIFYLFGSTDIHFENLVASGEHPYIVDLETLLHPNPETLQSSKSGNLRIFNDSVLRAGLLPRWMHGASTERPIDVSGLSSKESEIWPDAISQWRQVDTDDMRIELGVTAVSRSVRNVPVFAGRSSPASDHADAIKAGYRRIYKVLMDRRSELLSPRGPLDLFANDEVRVVLRSTQTYQTLVHASFHPELLRDALERDRFLDLMLWKEVDQAPFLALIVAAEKAQLLEGDVPRFATTPSSLDLHVNSLHESHKSGAPIKGFFAAPILDGLRRRIEFLSREDLEVQCLFTEGALRRNLAQPVQDPPAASSARARKSASVERVSNSSILGAAKILADDLIAQAYLETNRVAWFGPTLFARRHMAVQPLHWQLYDGLPGVALFLAYAGELLGTKKYTDLSRAAVDSLVDRLNVYARYIDSAGAFDGWCGVIYTLSHLGAVWDDDGYVDMAEGYTGKALEFESCAKSDIISGHAGSIACFLAVHQVTGSTRSLDASLSFGRRLVAVMSHLQTDSDAEGIDPALLDPHFGFAHGLHGIIWSLLKLGHVSGQSVFTSSALDLLEFCDSALKIDGAEQRSAAWCNGEGGVGLAWMDLIGPGHGGTVSAQRDLMMQRDFIIDHILRGRPQANHALCHGEMGTIELLATAHRSLAWPCQDKMLERLEKIVATIQAGAPYCGATLRMEHPGLMTGTSGIGLGLLRVVYPERVPSVLLMEAPTTQH